MQLERLSVRHSLLFVPFLFLFLFVSKVQSLPISASQHESVTLYGRSTKIANGMSNNIGLLVPRTKETGADRSGMHKRDDIAESRHNNERRDKGENLGYTTQPGQNSNDHPSTNPRGGSTDTPSKGTSTNDGKGSVAGGGHPPLKAKKQIIKARSQEDSPHLVMVKARSVARDDGVNDSGKGSSGLSHDEGSQPFHDPSSKDPSDEKPRDPNGKRSLRKRLDSINLGSFFSSLISTGNGVQLGIDYRDEEKPEPKPKHKPNSKPKLQPRPRPLPPQKF